MLRKQNPKLTKDTPTNVALHPPPSSGWVIVKQVMRSSLVCGGIGLAVRCIVGGNFVFCLCLHYLNISILMPLGALFGLIASTRELFLQKNGPIVRELERRLSSMRGLKQQQQVLSNTNSNNNRNNNTIGRNVQNAPSLPNEEEDESNEAVRSVSSILNTLTSGYTYWCLKCITRCFLPSSKVMFREIDRWKKKTSDMESSGHFVVSFCDAYLETWQYRLVYLGVLLYAVCVGVAMVIVRSF